MCGFVIPGSVVDCQYVGDSIKFSLGQEVFEFRSEPSAGTSYEVVLRKCGSEESAPPRILFRVLYDLSPEEYRIAVSSSVNDRSLFVHNIDGLMSLRVARDILSYLLVSLGNTEYNECMNERCTSEWGDYLHYLIGERMSGRPISQYVIN